MKKLLLFFLLFTTICKGQNTKYIEELILGREYEKADSILKKIILDEKKINSEITFLFGKNSYFLKQYNHKKAIRKPENRYPKKIRFWGFIKLSGIKFKTSKSILLS